MIRLGLVVLLAGVAAGSAGAASPNPKDLEIPNADLLRARSLIPRLGSEAFPEREHAEKELAKMGRFARPVLRTAAIEDPDPEVRQRAGRLLPKAEAAELKARTDAFLADVEGKYDHAMPGWHKFKVVMNVEPALFGLVLGTDLNRARAARQLFVEMLTSKPTVDLLTEVENGGEGLAKAAADRRMQMWLDMNPGVFANGLRAGGTSKPPSLAEFTALLFAEVQLEGRSIPRAGPFFVSTSQFFHAPSVRPAVQGGGPHTEAFRTILGAWFRNLTDNNELQQVAYLVTQMTIKEALPAMRKAVVSPCSPVYLKAQAVGAIAKLGGKDELPSLMKLLKDDTTIQPNRFPKMDLQVRDVALAMCVTVTGQDHKTYGYEIQQPLNDQIKYQYWTFAFRTVEKRDEAFKKWDEWTKTQSKK
jgi:hypothetical protein